MALGNFIELKRSKALINKEDQSQCVCSESDTHTHTHTHTHNIDCCCGSVAQLCPTLCDHVDSSTPGSSPPLSPRVCSGSCPLSQWCHPIISSSVAPFSSCLQSFPASGSFPVSWLFASGGQSIGASTSVLPMNIQDRFPLSPCSPRNFQESSPTPQFESINSSVFSLLCGPSLTSIQDFWKNHSFDYTDLCQQSNVSAFQYAV